MPAASPCRGKGYGFGLAALLATGLWGCAQTDIAATVLKEVARTPSTGEYKVGKPYQIDGVWYTPKEDPHYDEEGVASWYGEPFHGRKTANGEIYDMNELTAAHKTLPMPVYVRVTNLENGRSLVLRVNDRGPFVEGRIIDVSRRAAQLLDFQVKGVARVRVQAVDPDTQRTYAEMGVSGPETADGIEVAGNRQATQSADGARFVQVGAYRDAENVAVARSALNALGEVHLHRIPKDDEVLYRVRLGPFATDAEAESARRAVAERGYPEAIVVIEP